MSDTETLVEKVEPASPVPAEEAERVSSPFEERLEAVAAAEKAKTPEPETPAAALLTPPNEGETTAVVSEDPVLLTGIVLIHNLFGAICLYSKITSGIRFKVVR